MAGTKVNLIQIARGGRGVLPEILVGGVRPASQNPTLFMTKIYDIHYPIYDPTKNDKTIASKSCCRPAL